MCREFEPFIFSAFFLSLFDFQQKSLKGEREKTFCFELKKRWTNVGIFEDAEIGFLILQDG